MFHYKYCSKIRVKIVGKDSSFLKWCWQWGCGWIQSVISLFIWVLILVVRSGRARVEPSWCVQYHYWSRIHCFKPILVMKHGKHGFVNLRFQFKTKGILRTPFYALHKMCSAWWWTIRKDETRGTIKHMLNCVDCYYIITKTSIRFYLYRDNEDDVN